MVIVEAACLIALVATVVLGMATFVPARRAIVAGGLAAVVLGVPAAVVLDGHITQPAARVVADDCFVAVSGYPIPCGGMSGGSVSAGAPSQELLTAKNWCNLHIGGCSSAFFYPPGPVNRPDVDNTVRHSP